MVHKSAAVLATLAAFMAAAASAEARHLAIGNLKANIFAEAGNPITPIQCTNIWLQGDYAYEIVIHGTGVCSKIGGGAFTFLHWKSKDAWPGTGDQTGWFVIRQGNNESCQSPANAGNVPLAILVKLLGCN
jgi:hypothetical protein